MGATTGLDSDVWVTATPSIALAALELAANYDSGVFKAYRANIHLYWDNTAAAPVIQVGTDAKQSVTITGGPTGGTFTLTFGANTTTSLTILATAAQIQAALVALASIGTGNCLVTGPNGGPWTVEFINGKGGAPQSLMTSANTFTGGSSPSVAIASTQTGIAWATQSASLYTFQYVGGIITFTAALASTQVVSILTGNYFNVSQLANCKDWELNLKANIINVDIFQSGGGWGASQAAMKKATGKINSFIWDGTMDDHLLNLMVFVLYLTKTTGLRLECYGYLSDEAVKNAMSGVVTKDFSFESASQVYLLTAP